MCIDVTGKENTRRWPYCFPHSCLAEIPVFLWRRYL